MVTFTPLFSFSGVGRDAKGFQLGDVGLVVVGDVGNHHPVAVQVGAADFLDARQLFALDGAELGEIDLGPGQHSPGPAPVAASRGAAPWGLHRLLRGGLHSTGHDGLGKGHARLLG
jgi:hypothetical protein